jgi:hypothetical protein
MAREPARHPREPVEPQPRSDTIRTLLERLLREQAWTARELSGRVGIPERQVTGHLDHLARSLKARGERLAVDSARCLDCGFVFRKRDRLTRPSRCPACRSQHLTSPCFRIAASREADRP